MSRQRRAMLRGEARRMEFRALWGDRSLVRWYDFLLMGVAYRRSGTWGHHQHRVRVHHTQPLRWDRAEVLGLAAIVVIVVICYLVGRHA